MGQMHWFGTRKEFQEWTKTFNMLLSEWGEKNIALFLPRDWEPYINRSNPLWYRRFTSSYVMDDRIVIRVDFQGQTRFAVHTPLVSMPTECVGVYAD